MLKPKQIKKISNSFHVFNFTPTSPKPNTIVGVQGRAVHIGGLCMNQRCFRVSGKQHMYIHLLQFSLIQSSFTITYCI